MRDCYAITQLFHFFMVRVLAAAFAELAELQPVRGRLTVLGGGVVSLFAYRALHGHDFSGHCFFLLLLNLFIRHRLLAFGSQFFSIPQFRTFAVPQW
jgi:hypothetical protein